MLYTFPGLKRFSTIKRMQYATTHTARRTLAKQRLAAELQATRRAYKQGCQAVAHVRVPGESSLHAMSPNLLTVIREGCATTCGSLPGHTVHAYAWGWLHASCKHPSPCICMPPTRRHNECMHGVDPPCTPRFPRGRRSRLIIFSSRDQS